MTIVEPRPMVVRAETPEKDLQYVHAGLKGFARPTGYPDVKLSAIVADVADVPSAANTFDTKITDRRPGRLAADAGHDVLGEDDRLPEEGRLDGAALGLEDRPAGRGEALRLAGRQEGRGQGASGNRGQADRQAVEILKGLSEGDQVLREYPKDDDKKAPKDDDKKAPKHDDKKAPKDDDKKAEKK